MERYEFKVKWQEKCIKIFLSSAEVQSLNVYSLYKKIAERIPCINQKEFNLPSDDLDSFIDMVGTAKQSDSRENLKVIELKICELAQTSISSEASNKRPHESPLPKSITTSELSAQGHSTVHIRNLILEHDA